MTRAPKPRKKGKRHPNPRLAKLHRTYTVEEIATLYSVHRNTVRQWIKRGLPTCDDKRPTLVLGRDLAAFLQAQRTKNKRPCKPGEIYCVRCRAAKFPAGGMADYAAVTGTSGNLIGMCPTCEAMMYRRVNLAKLGQIRGQLDITLSEAQLRIVESGRLSDNSDLGKGLPHHDNAQPCQ